MESCGGGSAPSTAAIRNSAFDEFRYTDFVWFSMSCTRRIFKTLTIKNLSAANSLLHTATAHDANDNGCT